MCEYSDSVIITSSDLHKIIGMRTLSDHYSVASIIVTGHHTIYCTYVNKRAIINCTKKIKRISISNDSPEENLGQVSLHVIRIYESVVRINVYYYYYYMIRPPSPGIAFRLILSLFGLIYISIWIQQTVIHTCMLYATNPHISSSAHRYAFSCFTLRYMHSTIVSLSAD